MSMSYVVVCRAWSSSLRCILYETNTCIKRGRSTATWVHSPSSCMIPWPCDLHLVTLTSVQVVDMWPLTGATSQPTLETVQPYPFISVTARFASRLPRTFWFDLWPIKRQRELSVPRRKPTPNLTFLQLIILELYTRERIWYGYRDMTGWPQNDAVSYNCHWSLYILYRPYCWVKSAHGTDRQIQCNNITRPSSVLLGPGN